MKKLYEALGYGRVVKGGDTLLEFLQEGKAADMGVKYGDVDPEQLWMGTEIEMEHTKDKNIARKIALDHLSEFPKYYTALIAMEKRMKEGEFADEPSEEVDSEGSESLSEASS